MGKIADLKAKLEPFYKSLGTIHCPILDEDVIFGNTGWKHIRFKGNGERRNPSDIAMRFNLLKYIPHVIKNATAHIKEEGQTKNGKTITFYEMAEEVKVDGVKKHVTVILSKIENGNLQYLSVRYTRVKSRKAR